MDKNSKTDNILTKRKIHELAKKNNIKINENAINEVNNEASKFIKELFKSASYILSLEGRKVIKKKDIQEAKNNLEKKEQNYEI